MERGVSAYFSVAAQNANGQGPFSAPSNVGIPTAGLPDWPTSVAGVVPVTAGEVDLTWVAPTPTSPVTDYNVIPVIAGVAQTPISTGSTATSYAVTGLVSGTAYTFRVQAVNAVGNGVPCFDAGPYTPN